MNIMTHPSNNHWAGEDDTEARRVKNKRVEKLQADVDEIAVILHSSVDKLLERGEKLDILMDITDGLMEEASSFQTTSKKVKAHYKWKNRMYIVIGVVIVLIIAAAIVISILRPWED